MKIKMTEDQWADIYDMLKYGSVDGDYEDAKHLLMEKIDDKLGLGDYHDEYATFPKVCIYVYRDEDNNECYGEVLVESIDDFYDLDPTVEGQEFIKWEGTRDPVEEDEEDETESEDPITAVFLYLNSDGEECLATATVPCIDETPELEDGKEFIEWLYTV